MAFEDERGVTISEVATGSGKYRFPVKAGTVSLNADGSLIAILGLDGSVSLWSVQGDNLILTLPGTVSTVTSSMVTGYELIGTLAFSPDATLLATVAEDSTIQLWGVR